MAKRKSNLELAEKTYLVTTWKGALVGSFICLSLAALISSAVESILTWTAIFKVAAWILGIPLAMVSVGLTFAVLASKTKEEAMSNLLWIAVLAVAPLGIVTGLYPAGSEDDPLLTIVTVIFTLAWLTAAIGYFGKAVLWPWLREVGKEQVERVPQELRRLELEQEKKDEPKREPWALLSEAEIKEYLKTRGLKIDPTRYAPAQKSFGTIFSMLIPMAEFMWKGVCPHCGWGISAIHVIGSFRALTKCENCGELALLDRLAERFFAIVRSESGA